MRAKYYNTMYQIWRWLEVKAQSRKNLYSRLYFELDSKKRWPQ